jgi:alkylhydroperoxidase/carboxymuconolactone decarboxylase family protein YurZ
LSPGSTASASSTPISSLSRAGQKAGHLDEKTRELIALAVAITLRCDGHHGAYGGSGVRPGRSPKCCAPISVNAGAAVVYFTRALDAFDAAAEINPTS